MSTRIQIPPDQIPDLERICGIDASALELAGQTIEKLDPPPMSAVALSDEILAALGDCDRPKTETVAVLVGQMLAWCQVARNRSITVSQVLEGISSSVAGFSNLPDQLLQEWQEIQPGLLRLCETRAVQIVSKVMDLSYDYANLFEGARIIADIRPVFNDDDENMAVDGAVVSYTLRLNYDNRNGRQNLSITLDEFDINSLVSQCERALQKGRVAQERFETVAPTVRTGEESGG